MVHKVVDKKRDISGNIDPESFINKFIKRLQSNPKIKELEDIKEIERLEAKFELLKQEHQKKMSSK